MSKDDREDPQAEMRTRIQKIRLSLAWMVCWTLLMPSGSSAQSELLEASIEELQGWLAGGEITSVELVDWYLQRIDTYDQQGPSLNAIQHLNEKARDQALSLIHI